MAVESSRPSLERALFFIQLQCCLILKLVQQCLCNTWQDMQKCSHLYQEVYGTLFITNMWLLLNLHFIVCVLLNSWQIVTKQGQSLTLDLHNRNGNRGLKNLGKLTVHAEETVASRNAIEVIFRCSHLDNKDLFSKSVCTQNPDLEHFVTYWCIDLCLGLKFFTSFFFFIRTLF